MEIEIPIKRHIESEISSNTPATYLVRIHLQTNLSFFSTWMDRRSFRLDQRKTIHLQTTVICVCVCLCILFKDLYIYICFRTMIIFSWEYEICFVFSLQKRFSKRFFLLFFAQLPGPWLPDFWLLALGSQPRLEKKWSFFSVHHNSYSKIGPSSYAAKFIHMRCNTHLTQIGPIHN